MSHGTATLIPPVSGPATRWGSSLEAWKLTFAVWLAGFLYFLSDGCKARTSSRKAEVSDGGNCVRPTGRRDVEHREHRGGARFDTSPTDPFAGSSTGRALGGAVARSTGRLVVRVHPREPVAEQRARARKGEGCLVLRAATNAAVAQIARALGLESRGRWFKSIPLLRAGSSAGRTPGGVRTTWRSEIRSLPCPPRAHTSQWSSANCNEVGDAGSIPVGPSASIDSRQGVGE